MVHGMCTHVTPLILLGRPNVNGRPKAPEKADLSAVTAPQSTLLEPQSLRPV